MHGSEAAAWTPVVPLGADFRAHEREEAGIVRIGNVDADRRLVSHPVQREDRARRHEDPGIGRPRRQRHVVEAMGKRALDRYDLLLAPERRVTSHLTAS